MDRNRKCMCIVALVLGAGAVPGSAEEKPASIISSAIQPLKDAGKELKPLEKFIESSVENYANLQKRMKEVEINFNRDYGAASNDGEKRKLSVDYLKTKQSMIGQMLGDFDFVNEKLSEKVESLNAVIGAAGQKSSIVQKAQEAAANTSAITKKIQQTQLDWRNIEAKAPKRGTPEYMKWYRKSLGVRRTYGGEVARFKTAVRREIIYEWLAKQIDMSAENIGLWQEYIQTLSFSFELNRETLAGEKELTADYIAVVESGVVFDEIINVTKLSGILGKAVEGMTGMGMPPFPGPGGVDYGDIEGKIGKMMSSIGGDPGEPFDPVALKREIKESLSKTMMQ